MNLKTMQGRHDPSIDLDVFHGRYWIRTSDPFRVKEVRYRCANRPHRQILNHRSPPAQVGAGRNR
jgi:hypothetical protein